MSFQRSAVLVTLIFIFSVSACKSSAPVRGEHWVIFSEDQARGQSIGSWLGVDVDYWTPGQEDANAVESGVAAYLQENADSFYMPGPSVWERLDEYNRQYIGLIVDDRKIIYANFFCDGLTDWEQEFVMVLDGGACYFQFKYDPDTEEFLDLQVNGEA